MLCPIDFERDSMDALELACAMAKQNSATIYLLTVIGVPPAGATALPPVPIFPNLNLKQRPAAGWKHLRTTSCQGFRMRFSLQVETRRRRFLTSQPNGT